MVNTRSYPPHDRKTRSVILRCRLYASSRTKPQQVKVTTRCWSDKRCPYVENAMDQAPIQPYIHNCTAVVYEGARVHRFLVFFKNHRALRANHSIRRVPPALVMRGDVIVMRLGCRVPWVVNMRKGDSSISDYLVTRFVAQLNRHKRPPRSVTFHKTARV